MFTLLLVEDDTAIREMLTIFLNSQGFNTKSAENGEQALTTLQEMSPDLILLDWMLPDTEGPALLKQIRANKVQRNIPVIMLTARAEEADKITGLNVGADDYMTKPVSLHELNARINALLRRTQGLSDEKLIESGSITLDPNTNQLTINKKIIKIGQLELSLLRFFLLNAERVYSRNQLLDHIWGQNSFIDERTVDVHILRLRKILKPYQLDKTIKTIRGAGYQYSPYLENL